MNKRKFLFSSVLAAVATIAGPGAAFAQMSYPERPIKMVVPFPPGGAADNVARLMAAGLAEKLGQPVIIDNKAGAGTIIGTDVAAKSMPDGYTLFLMTTPFAINATLYRKLPYETFKSFIPIIDLTATPLVMIVNPSSTVASVEDLTSLAKANPGAITFGSSGVGGSPHLAMEMYSSAAGIKFNHVPYKGSVQAVMDLIAGQTDVVIDTLVLTDKQVKAGKARAIAQTGLVRSPFMPDVPTMQESGIKGYEVTSWLSVAAPAGTSPEIVDKLNKAINEWLGQQSVRENLEKQGFVVLGGSAADSAAHLKEEVARWGEAVKSSGATAE